MIFYRVSHHDQTAESHGFTWTTSKAEAEKAKRDRLFSPGVSKIERVEIKPTKRGILEALQKYADHPDNG